MSCLQFESFINVPLKLQMFWAWVFCRYDVIIMRTIKSSLAWTNCEMWQTKLWKPPLSIHIYITIFRFSLTDKSKICTRV